MKSDILLSVCSLKAGYGEKEVLREVSFEIEPGTLVCLMGANGSGKTTLLKCLANQMHHKGNCYLKGSKLENRKVRSLAEAISYIPQKSGVSIELPVLDVVLMGCNAKLGLLQYPGKKHKEQALKSLKKVGLEKESQRNYLSLSEGQKQLVILARMLVEETTLLLLDEPDSALDVSNRYRMMEQLKDMIKGQEKAAVLCLHDPLLALEFCDEILLLKEGNIYEILKPEKDSTEKIEQALQNIFGKIRLLECFDKEGKRHFSLLGL